VFVHYQGGGHSHLICLLPHIYMEDDLLFYVILKGQGGGVVMDGVSFVAKIPVANVPSVEMINNVNEWRSSTIVG
jgi:hypothetical protein